MPTERGRLAAADLYERRHCSPWQSSRRTPSKPAHGEIKRGGVGHTSLPMRANWRDEIMLAVPLPEKDPG